MTEDEFIEEYLVPFEVDGVNLEDVESIYHFYKEKMLACETLGDMDIVLEKFKFLCARKHTGSLKTIPISNDYKITVELIKAALHEGKSIPEELKDNLYIYDIILPPVMLHAYLVAKEFSMPEYPAAIQYCRAMWFNKEEESTYA